MSIMNVRDPRLPKQDLYWDIDDVILDTTETVVDIINKKYREPNGLPLKTREECKDWGFKSLYPLLTKKEQEEIFESEEFWKNVNIKEDFYNLLESGLLYRYNNFFITKGSELNLKKKEKYLREHIGKYFQDFEYIGLTHDKEKNIIDMSGAIQIDDNYNNLKKTNARLKVLMKNNIENTTNNSFGLIDTPDNLYNINSLKEISDILAFNLIETL